MTGITYGTFDFCHEGHINLLSRIRAQCDYVIVGLSTDEFNAQKGKTSYYPYNQRKQMLEQTGLVDLVIPEVSWDQKLIDVIAYSADKFFMGSDWTSKFDFLIPYCEVIYLPRTEGISSTQIKKFLMEENLDASKF